MNRVWRLALNDVRLALRDRPSFIWMLVLPLALMWLFGNMNSGGGSAKASLSIVDADGGWLALQFVESLEADEQFNVRTFTVDEAAAAENKVRTLYIPEGFTEGVLAGRPQTLRLEKDPDTSGDFAMAAEVRIIRTTVSTIGRLVELIESGEISDGEAAAPGVAEHFAELGRRPPLVDLDVTTAGEGRPVPGGRAQSVPGMLTMSVTMMTIIYGAVFLTTEKRSGTLRRQRTLPIGRRHIFAGKLLGRLVLAGLQTAVLLLAGRFVFGVSFGQSLPGLLLLVTSFCVAIAGLSTLVGAVLRTPEQAGSIGWILGMVLAALGGAWWPSEVMPRWLWQAAHVLPTAWAMDGFHALISFGYGLESVILPSAALLAFGAIYSLVGARFLRTDATG